MSLWEYKVITSGKGGFATPALLEQVAKAGPFGAGNPEPVFAFPAHKLAYAETFGAGWMRTKGALAWLAREWPKVKPAG